MTKSANVKTAKCTCGNGYSAPLHNLYGTHENSIPFLHRDLAAAFFTLLSLLNRETCRIFRMFINHTPTGGNRAPSATLRQNEIDAHDIRP
jgi:hypothetical protein